MESDFQQLSVMETLLLHLKMRAHKTSHSSNRRKKTQHKKTPTNQCFGSGSSMTQVPATKLPELQDISKQALFISLDPAKKAVYFKACLASPEP